MKDKRPSPSVLPALSSAHQQLVDQLIAGYQKPACCRRPQTDHFPHNAPIQNCPAYLFAEGRQSWLNSP